MDCKGGIILRGFWGADFWRAIVCPYLRPFQVYGTLMRLPTVVYRSLTKGGFEMFSASVMHHTPPEHCTITSCPHIDVGCSPRTGHGLRISKSKLPNSLKSWGQMTKGVVSQSAKVAEWLFKGAHEHGDRPQLAEREAKTRPAHDSRGENSRSEDPPVEASESGSRKGEVYQKPGFLWRTSNIYYANIYIIYIYIYMYTHMCI